VTPAQNAPPEQRAEQPHGRHAPSMSERLLAKAGQRVTEGEPD
jgi:hypothetical protein